MPYLGNLTIELLPPVETIDTAGNDVIRTYSTSISISGCMVQPFLLSEKLQFELTGERTFTRSTWRVWAPPLDSVKAITPEYRVRFKGEVYEVFGHIGVWYTFSGAESHVQFIIQEREG